MSGLTLPLAVLAVLLAAGNSRAAAPVIFFSDLTSGPNYGGERDAGVCVTLSGSNFGSQRGEGFVSVGDVPVQEYRQWSGSRVVFQPGKRCRSGMVRVHTAGGVSNPVGFQVRKGRIFFVSASSPDDPGVGTVSSPWRSPASFYRAMQPGDTCYIRAGVYSGRYGSPSSHTNVGFGPEAPDASSGNEIAWVAYPGEKACFQARSETGGCFEWRKPRDHYVIAGFYLAASGRPCVSLSGRHHRVINNDCEGNTEFSYALLFLDHCSFADVFGNRLHGMASGNKLSHPLYIGGAGSNIDFGWNTITGNNVAEGPLICVNQDNARQRRARFTDIVIHDNFIDGANGANQARGIGFAVQDDGSSAAVFNNVIINCSKALYVMSGSVDFLNNTVSGSRGPSAVHIYSAHGYSPARITIKNNILAVTPGCAYVRRETEAGVGIGYNLYWGNSGIPEEDSYPVAGDPAFVCAEAGNLRLSTGSPAIDAGDNAAGREVARDFDGNARILGKKIDIGAFERPENEEPTKPGDWLR